MKYKIILTLILMTYCGYRGVSAQEPFVKARLVDRNVHEQDGHFLITTSEANSYVYVVEGDVIATSEYFPFILLHTDTTSTAFPTKIEGLSVFPNPTQDILVIHRENVDEELTIALYTTDGKQVMQNSWPPGVTSFQSSLSALTHGQYILILSNKTGTRGNQYKIIKQ